MLSETFFGEIFKDDKYTQCKYLKGNIFFCGFAKPRPKNANKTGRTKKFVRFYNLFFS